MRHPPPHEPPSTVGLLGQGSLARRTMEAWIAFGIVVVVLLYVIAEIGSD